MQSLLKINHTYMYFTMQMYTVLGVVYLPWLGKVHVIS